MRASRGSHERSRGPQWPGGLFALAAAGLGCAEARPAPADAGEHPAGWIDASSPSFHAKWLRANGEPLDQCRTCHGASLDGGAVGVSCATQGCHTHPEGPLFCGTCHGGADGPLPSTGAHALHAAFCDDCHHVPKAVSDPGHIGPEARVVFSGLASLDAAKPAFDAVTRTCSGVYCHAGSTPVWETPAAPAPCDFCHGTPPESHVRWRRVATPATCGTCHPVPTAPVPGGAHLNGIVDLLPDIACDTCHGRDSTGAPPVALDGSTSPSARGVGAHRAHLDPTVAGRIGKAVACAVCHVVPTAVTQPGHLGTAPTATVVLAQGGVAQGGTFDPASAACVTGCHWDRSPGPTWNDVSGAPTQCDACHGFPPVHTRDGRIHTACAPTVSACVACHVFTPETHVDGHVDLQP